MSRAESATVRLSFLGEPAWHCGTANGLLTGKFAALLAYLAIERRQPREALSQLLWPGDRQRAKDSLRQTVSRLHRAIGHDVVEQGAVYTLAAGIASDIDEHPSRAPLQRLLELGVFLPGLSFPGLQRLEHWLNTQRVRWNEAVAEALATHVDEIGDTAAIATGLAAVDRALTLAPWLESAWRARMRMHYLRGDVSAALHAYDVFVEQHCRAHGRVLDEQTQALVAVLRSAARAPTPRPQRLPEWLQRPPRLVGRDAAIVAMAHAWSAARPFLLRGEPGIGKSRLLVDFVMERGEPLVSIDCRPGEEQWPFATAAKLALALVRQGGPLPAGGWRMELARLLPELGTPPTTPLTDESRLWRAFEALLLQSLEHGLRVVAVDDLQYADLASLQLLRWLAAAAAHTELRFAFATRPLPSGPAQDLVDDWLVDSHRPELVPVGALSLHDVAALLASLPSSGPQAAPMLPAEQLYRRAGGHPFFTLEVLRAFITGDNGEDARLPPGAAPLLERRLRSAPAQAVDLVHVAGVLGTELTPERAARALDLPLPELSARWSSLQALGILRGDDFAHDLLREAALARLDAPERMRWHACVARALAVETDLPPARVAVHWEEAQQWPQAAACFYAAGLRARDSGRLQEQSLLLARAAAASARSGDRAGEFEARHADFPAELARGGREALDAQLARLSTLAASDEQRARVSIARAEAMVYRFDLPADALRAAEDAVVRSLPHPRWLAEARHIRAAALAQCDRFDDAIAEQRRALDAAQQIGDERQYRAAAANTGFLYWRAGRLGEAVTATQEAIALVEEAGDAATAAQLAGNVAFLQVMRGHPAAAVAPALRARERYSEIGIESHGTVPGMTCVALGSALTYLGRFDEAADALDEALRILDAEAPVATRAKAQLARAHLWLLLGAAEAARAVLPALADDWIAPLQVQWHWAHWRASAIDRQADATHLRRIGEIQCAHWNAPLSQSAWLEWSRQGPSAEVVAQLRLVRAQYEEGDMPGTARAAALRLIDRLAELDGDAVADEAAALVDAVRSRIGDGLHPSVYLPEAWAVMARALRRVGRDVEAEAAIEAARTWVRSSALPHVPAQLRDSFLRLNATNAALGFE